MIVRASGWYEKDALEKVKNRITSASSNRLSQILRVDLLKMVARQPKRNKAKENIITRRNTENTAEKGQKIYHLFLDDKLGDDSALSPHRPGVDTKVRLIKDDLGRELEVPWGLLYGMLREELLVLRKTLTDILDKNWIRASSSPGGAPVLFMKKPGGGLRFCVDYRALNAITKRDRYPLPLIRETMQMLSNSKWLSKIDVRSAFHRLCISEGDEWKTAFRTRFGSHEWLVTPFGLAGAPPAFQRWINQELGGFSGSTCSACVDDVIIFSDGDLVDHWNKVDQVLVRLNKAGLKLDPQKCEFARKEIKYLGFIVNVDQGVRSFLGFANFYREFIENFARISAPLQDLTKKGTMFHWSDQHQKSFHRLKSLFITAPVLALWDGELETVLETDASGWATGGCLSQIKPGGKLQSTAYYSKKLSPAEYNYDIHDKELLAIVRCLKEWRNELIGLKKPFQILTDHKNLKYFMTSKRLTERQVRWAQLLSDFNFKLKFRAGKHGGRPDALSRRAQDVPMSLKDPRLKVREFKLLKDEWLPRAAQNGEDGQAPMLSLVEISIPRGDQLFEDEDLQRLWGRGVSEDGTQFQELYHTMWSNKDQFTTKL
ncbi:hypothetical protein K3495_g6045 [Podosphaera aphanis]|nr:hypothetical protein K3495_g6045 [Podosphaera aphanis]